MPLAFSARCFTARPYNRPKDDCGFACIEHPDGQLLQTREGEGFLVLNGIQTQSARVHNLLQDVPALRALDVDLLRLSPQSQHMAEVIAAFDAARHAAQPDPTALERMRALMPAAPCNGYWHGKPGLDLIVESAHA
jgi:collagenase-like PrtC family protease